MGTNLIVKNLPAKFSDKDKKEFLNLFGSQQVTCLNGRLKHCCFAEFPDVGTAKQALDALHQFEVLGQTLVVEYAKPLHEKLSNEIQANKVLERKNFLQKKKKKEENLEDNTKTSQEESDLFSGGLAPSLGLNHNFPGHLHYKYPEPNVQILTNIANALATVPKFYTLVLNLMNKMHLPPPFTGVTPTPPLPDNNVNMQDASVDTADLHAYGSSEESELESDSENKKHEIYMNNKLPDEPIRKKKRLRAAATINQEKLQVKKLNADLPVESFFELNSSVKRLEFKLGNSIKDAVEKKSAPAVHFNVFDERGQFGTIEPVPKAARLDDTKNTNPEIANITSANQDISEENMDGERNDDLSNDLSSEEEDEENTEYISSKQLNDNKILPEEILNMNQFKNYKQGDQTNRIYIKNIGKQVTTDELFFIFKRFIRHCTDEEKATLDIRHMKEGRMKGQAFVTFPNENIAEKALKCVHGYILQDKPMVIQYGKSGK